MTFQWPFFLWTILIVPILALMYILAQRRRKKYALRYASLTLVKEALGKGPGWKRHVPPALFLASVGVMLFALARPIAIVTLPSNEGTVILSIDVSGSMLADDVKPNRMEAAKSAARLFVDKQPQGVKIGIVSFSDNAFIVQAPTTDHDAVIAAINRLQPQRGTAIGRGILTSLDAIFENPNSDFSAPDTRPSQFGPTPTPTPTPIPVPKGKYAPALVILLTDGENNRDPEPLQILDQAVNRGVRIYTVGLGTVEGTILRIQGRAIRTRVDEYTLKKIAEETDALYFNAANEKELQAIYEKLGTQLVLVTQKTEVTAGFTGLAVALSLLGGILSLLWFNRLP
ncbi:MAG: VWA domain-containing protein [Chloroflexi bacterium]|nr:VWA domain-containing protein [Chloroflexota bacterium]